MVASAASRNLRAVRLGVASHNLFDVAYGLLLRRQHGVDDAVEFEMLEGMANHQARAVQHTGGCCSMRRWSRPRISLAPLPTWYAAWTKIPRRRTSSATSSVWSRTVTWRRQRDRFLAACQIQNEVLDRPRRTQDRRTEQPVAHHHQPFDNEPDTDWSLPANQVWIKAVTERWREMSLEPIPLQIGGEFVHSPQHAAGLDPSRPHQGAYRYALADLAHVEQALDVAKSAADVGLALDSHASGRAAGSRR
jgi:RHH-type proline utilization regulon transcriptional repressor/proline dehydrogenase/delta 1-pyrroline-5-carboxylate dehydrogenase